MPPPIPLMTKDLELDMTCPYLRPLVVQDLELKMSCTNPCPLNRRHRAGDDMPPPLPPDDKRPGSCPCPTFAPWWYMTRN